MLARLQAASVVGGLCRKVNGIPSRVSRSALGREHSRTAIRMKEQLKRAFRMREQSRRALPMREQLRRPPPLRERLKMLPVKKVRSCRCEVSTIRKPGGASLRCHVGIAMEPCSSALAAIVAAATSVWLEATFAARTWTDISSLARGKVASAAEMLARRQAASVAGGRCRKVSGIPSRVRRNVHGWQQLRGAPLRKEQLRIEHLRKALCARQVRS